LLAGLSTIYYSPLCDEDTKQLILSQLVNQKVLKPRQKPPHPRVNRPPHEINVREFAKFMEPHLETYSALYER